MSKAKVQEQQELNIIDDFETKMYGGCIVGTRNVYDYSGEMVSLAYIVQRHDGVEYVRQPCNARGVIVKPGDNPHTPRFAYIDIPVNTSHGTVLSCCHPGCSASGRRFRFCSFCQAAVAKRNFNVRHAHGVLILRDDSA